MVLNDVNSVLRAYPVSKVHGANRWPIWGRQDQGGPHVGPTNFAIWVSFRTEDNQWPVEQTDFIFYLHLVKVYIFKSKC